MKMKFLTLAAALVLTVPAFSDTQQDTAPKKEQVKEEEIHVEENPELCFEDFSMDSMDEKDKASTGYNKLTPTEREAIANWFKNRDTDELDAAAIKQEEPAKKDEPAQPVMKPEEPKPAEQVSIITPINPSEANNALQAAIEDGKMLVLESKTKCLVPTLLRKKTANWKSGDILKVEMTKRANWAKITNLISNETILAKIEPEDIKK